MGRGIGIWVQIAWTYSVMARCIANLLHIVFVKYIKIVVIFVFYYKQLVLTVSPFLHQIFSHPFCMIAH